VGRDPVFPSRAEHDALWRRIPMPMSGGEALGQRPLLRIGYGWRLSDVDGVLA
jgi:hypothetical protein